MSNIQKSATWLKNGSQEALHVVLPKGEKRSFSIKNKTNKKNLPLPYPEIWGESCQVMIEVLLSTGM